MNNMSIISFLKDEYNLSVNQIVEIQSGMVGDSFLVESSQGKYFLKIYGNSRLANIAKENIEFYVNALDVLKTKKLKIPEIIPNNQGNLFCEFEKNPLLIFQFIQKDQQIYSDKKIEQKIAKTLANIHKETLGLKFKINRFEDFNQYFKNDLIAGLQTLQKIDNQKDFKYKLKEVIKPFEEKILNSLDKLKKLGEQCQNIDQNFALCNTDPVGDNLIISNNECYLVDWDGAKLAPIEHDVWFYLDDKDFFQEYSQNISNINIRRENIKYFAYFRNLEDLTDWIIRILHENQTDEDNHKDLEDLQTDCLMQLDNIDHDTDNRFKNTER